LVSAAEALAAIVRRHHAGIRARFPALRRDLTGRRRTYLNNAGGTILCEDSVRSMSRIARHANAQDGTITPGECATARVHAAARRAVADFLNAPSPEEISFHQSASHALFNLSFAFRDSLRPGDNLVVTRLDHAANVTPWKSFWGEDRGLEIRECGVTRDGMLDLDHLARLVDRRTRIVAVTCASNGLGSVVPIEAIVRLARRHGTPRPGSRARGALVVVDAVHHACHAPLDVRMLGCDFLVFSGYKVFGPMGGVLWGRRRWLTALRPYRVEANADETPFKYEQGTPNHAVLAGITGAMEYLEWLGARIERDAARRPGLKPLYREVRRRYPDPARRRLKWAMTAARAHERTLSLALLDGFARLARRGVRLHGLTDPDRVDERDPTFLFEIRGLSQETIKRRLYERGRIEVPTGNYYSLAVYRHLRRRQTVRASFAHYDGLDTVRHFLKTLESAARR
jgi:cysteine desulfurase family protein (TIGR01976 family)